MAMVATHDHPWSVRADDAAELRRLAGAVDADAQTLYSSVPDPRLIDNDLRPLVGTGVLVPRLPGGGAGDAEHFERSSPSVYRQVVEDAAIDLGLTVEECVASEHFQTACSYARWMQAWGCDLVFAHGVGNHAFIAWVAARLLGVACALRLGRAWQCDELSFVVPRVLDLPLSRLIIQDDHVAPMMRCHGESVQDRVVAWDGVGDIAVSATGSRIRCPSPSFHS